MISHTGIFVARDYRSAFRRLSAKAICLHSACSHVLLQRRACLTSDQDNAETTRRPASLLSALRPPPPLSPLPCLLIVLSAPLDERERVGPRRRTPGAQSPPLTRSNASNSRSADGHTHRDGLPSFPCARRLAVNRPPFSPSPPPPLHAV
ncbi:hypothetical protein BDW22DRAFT_256922 [Trametopsis cervina]|nr:hypothetical protein BDW22DRAFT_256922 [Trametopsis cervina]